MNSKPQPSPAPPRPLGHGYCWQQHPNRGLHCIQPIGHKAKGVEHLHPYVNPPLRWS